MTREEFDILIAQAQAVVNEAASNANQLNFGQSVKEDLLNSSQSIQDILDLILANNGVITSSQEQQLDEEMRLAKKRLLESQQKITMQRYSLIGGVGIISIAILWYLTRK
jgi:putative NADH-flavin reductase